MENLACHIWTLPLIGIGAGIVVGLWLLVSLFLKTRCNISVELTLILPIVVYLLVGASWRDLVELVKMVAVVIVGALSGVLGLYLMAVVSEYIYTFLNK